MFERNSTVDQNLLDRVVLAQKVGAYLSKDDVPRDQRRKVENFALMLAHDVSDEVRQCLAFELRRAPDLPKALVMLIVRDIESVCEPFLKSTELFTDEQWVELLDELEEHALAALARRSRVSEPMSFALANQGGQRCVSGLMQNPGAEVSERVCNTVIDRFEGDESVLNAMANRGDLPMSVVETLVTFLTDQARQKLVENYGVPEAVAKRVTVAAADRSILERLTKLQPHTLSDTLRDLDTKGRLTDSLFLAATEKREWHIVSAMLAQRAAMPATLVESIIASKNWSRIDELIGDATLASDVAETLRSALAKLQI